MKTKESKEKDLITKEQIDLVLKAITNTTESSTEEKLQETEIDFDKVSEVLRNLEGTSLQTVAACITSGMLLLPAEILVQTMDLLKMILRRKILSDLSNVFGQFGKEN